MLFEEVARKLSVKIVVGSRMGKSQNHRPSHQDLSCTILALLILFASYISSAYLIYII